MFLRSSLLVFLWSWSRAIVQSVGLLYRKGEREESTVICRQNYLDVQQWLEYQQDVKLVSRKTVHKYWSCIRYLIEWADAVPLPKVHGIRPVYPIYLRDVPVVRNDKPTGQVLSKKTQELACSLARRFFTWARLALHRYQQVDPLWIESLRPGRTIETIKKRELYSLDDVLAITKPVPGDSLKEQRDKAAVALLFLSGMRVGAFTTLPASALDLDEMTVKQWPELGVATKNGKAATTYLLDIPGLLAVVRVWDDVIRSALAPKVMWYARLKYDPSRDQVSIDDTTPPNSRRGGLFAKGLKELCRSAGIPYHSPHKLRHGHAVYALKRARTVAELKAVSQNLMHADLKTTDRIYGVLTDNDIKSKIAGLTDDGPVDDRSIADLLESVLVKVRQEG
jgi:site-specific recombinase XerD